MIPFIEYLEENFAPNIRPVIGDYVRYTGKDLTKDIIDIIWISEKKLKEIAQYLKSEHNIEAHLEKAVEGETVIAVKMPSQYKGRKFQLFPDNVLVLYPEEYRLFDATTEKHRIMVHQMNMAYPKQFKYQKKV